MVRHHINKGIDQGSLDEYDHGPCTTFAKNDELGFISIRYWLATFAMGLPQSQRSSVIDTKISIFELVFPLVELSYGMMPLWSSIHPIELGSWF